MRVLLKDCSPPKKNCCPYQFNFSESRFPSDGQEWFNTPIERYILPQSTQCLWLDQGESFGRAEYYRYRRASISTSPDGQKEYFPTLSSTRTYFAATDLFDHWATIRDHHEILIPSIGDEQSSDQPLLEYFRKTTHWEHVRTLPHPGKVLGYHEKSRRTIHRDGNHFFGVFIDKGKVETIFSLPDSNPGKFPYTQVAAAHLSAREHA